MDNPEFGSQDQPSVDTKSSVLTPPEILNSDYAARLFMLLQEHGQGAQSLIKNIAQFVKATHPQWTMDDQLRDEIPPLIMDKVNRFLSHASQQYEVDRTHLPDTPVLHPFIDPAVREEDIRNRLRDIQEILNADPVKDVDDVVENVAYSVMVKDFDNLHDRGGRVRHGVDPSTPKGDPWLSFLCYYGLQEHTTHNPILDNLYKRINEGIRSGKMLMNLNRGDDARYTKVLDIYNEHHPDNPVVW